MTFPDTAAVRQIWLRWRAALGIVLLAATPGIAGPVTARTTAAASLTGTWVGRASGIETGDFTMALVQSGANVSGTGDVFFPGDGNRFAFDVTGSNDGSNVRLTLQLRTPLQRPAITYTGPVNGSMILGRLNGGDIQHDGPFLDTPLTLRQNTITPGPTLSFDKTSLTFTAISSGAAFTSQTAAQTVRLAQSGSGTVTWTAASNKPWLMVSPASGSGPTTLSVGVKFDATLPASGSTTGAITLTSTGSANTPGPVNVTMNLASSSAAASPPFGSFDTPAGDATVLAGSVALTGWTLDNVGVRRVEIWRDRQAGETTTPFASTPDDPRQGKVFISNATFVDGARPDVEGLHPTTPFNYRAGWGYLLLTQGLWNQGNGTYKVFAFASDQENNVSTIGAKTLVVSNDAATKPFGAIDTPAIGGDASGPNFGWGLTPKVNGVATCKIQPSGVQVSIDSGPLQPVVYGEARSDIAGAFTGFSNTAAAGGHYIFDWSTLTNGAHTIGWLITDDCNRADGVGSRFFNVTTGRSAVTVAPGDFRLKADAAEIRHVASAFGRNEHADSVLVSRGYGQLPEIVEPGIDGSLTVEVRHGERIEIRVPRGFESAYQIVNGGVRRALPIGSTWDGASGILYWQPAPGFLGRYRIVFSNGTERINVRVVVMP